MVLQGICHDYQTAGASHRVLHNVSLVIVRGRSYAITGASGSGKSTLLNILGLLDQPSSGRFMLEGLDVQASTSDQRAGLRNRCIGFVFQSFNLLPRLSALDNVALPLLYRGVSRTQARLRAGRQLQRVGLGERALNRPADLSGGQRQRVAIARALVGEPALILADEPTGNLDDGTAADIMNLLLTLNRNDGVTLVMVTHDSGLARCLDQRLHVQDGHILARDARHA
ncbi:ABC transporter ATP-binding protein [Pseudomonas sp. LP_7_YM]|uniref:ABC transporter ATP-binding protein n=1 Tax=Pseudomonas sp. LP_7_YM TaxID=2485137 RepID=UPI002115A163|nr:ABC transporter ATP-binding protein [Pseudomonas sp. LP_7_YM]